MLLLLPLLHICVLSQKFHYLKQCRLFVSYMQCTSIEAMLSKQVFFLISTYEALKRREKINIEKRERNKSL